MSKSTSLAQLHNANQGAVNEQLDGGMDGGSMADVDDVMNQLGNNQEVYFDQQLQQQQQQQHQQQQPQQGQMTQQQAQMMAVQEQQAQMYAAQQQQAQMMAAQQMQQQQQAQMMAGQPQYLPKQPALGLLPTNTKQQSIVEKLVAELKDSLIVLVVFVLLNFKPVGQMTFNLLSKVTQNEHILLLARGAMAGVLFYIVKRLILNQ
jgi:hypothetical protein